MEKPAAIFSEQGLKMFLDFIKDVQASEPKQDTAVDKLVQEFYARPDKPDLQSKVEEADNKVDMEHAAKVVTNFMLTNTDHEYTTQEIYEELLLHGVEMQARGISPVMRGVMNRVPQIKRVDKGVYRYEKV